MSDTVVNFSHDGHCSICDQDVTFTSKFAWFRDHLFCSNCKSIPRERALMRVIKQFYPNYNDLIIHESSPGGRGVSLKIAKECEQYSRSFFFEDTQPGQIHPQRGDRCENLEALTYADESFDLLITQDVMEHVFDPERAFSEIARVLKPGGAHIFTVPLVRKVNASVRRASLSRDGEITHHLEPQFHGNPIDPEGALVTMDWGYDITMFIQEHAKTPSLLLQIDDISAGIRAEYIDVIASFKY